MMTSDLPEDLVDEILSRVPAMFLKRLRSTCKRWNALFKDLQFAEKHFRKAPKQSLVLMLKVYKFCSVSVNLNIALPSIEFQDELCLKDSRSNSEEQVDIAQVCHCDGLLLCKTRDNRLVVWNPCLGEIRWIRSKTAYKTSFRFVIGYRNSKSCRSYKILRYWDKYEQDYNPVYECEIYDFSSDSWRVLYDINLKCFILGNDGVSLKGNSYWHVFDGTGHFLLCFDFTTETFRRTSLPPSQNRICMAISVVREEQLSVLLKRTDTSEMEIWLTNNFDTESALLWSKLFPMDLHFMVYMTLLIGEEKKVLLCCSGSSVASDSMVHTIGEDDEYYTEIPFEVNSEYNTDEEFRNKSPCSPLIFNYVPSLVQIQQGRGKRKNEISGEK